MSIFNRVKEIVKTIRFSGSPRLYGRSSSGAGNGEEISIGSGLTLTGGVLAATGVPAAHTHTISEVTNLQSTLDGKAATAHTHDAIVALSATTPPLSTNEIKATGTITVVARPTVGQTLTIGGVVYTFAASQTTPFDIVIDGFMSNASVATAITTQINARDKKVVAARSGSIITLTALAQREEGNLVTLATTSSNLTLSNSTLVNGGSAVFPVEIAPTSGSDMQHLVVASRHVFICLNNGFTINWILIS